MKCQNCGKKVARFPLKDNDGKLIVKNLFKMDLMSIIWIIVITFMMITYKVDTETCREIITDPVEYCEESKACKIIEERKRENPFGIIRTEDTLESRVIQEFNTDIT